MSQQNNAQENEVIQGSYLTPAEEAYYDLGKELLKRNIPILNDALRHIITLSVTMLGGGIAFLNEAMVGRDAKITALLCFLVALIVAFRGAMPITDRISLDYPFRVRDSYESAQKQKIKKIRWSTGWLTVGLTVLLLGCLLSPYR